MSATGLSESVVISVEGAEDRSELLFSFRLRIKPQPGDLNKRSSTFGLTTGVYHFFFGLSGATSGTVPPPDFCGETSGATSVTGFGSFSGAISGIGRGAFSGAISGATSVIGRGFFSARVLSTSGEWAALRLYFRRDFRNYLGATSGMGFISGATSVTS